MKDFKDQSQRNHRQINQEWGNLARKMGTIVGEKRVFWVDTMNGTNANDRAAQFKNGVGGLTDESVEGDWRLPTETELYNLANGTEAVIDFHIFNFTALSVVGVLQYSLLPLAL